MISKKEKIHVLVILMFLVGMYFTGCAGGKNVVQSDSKNSKTETQADSLRAKFKLSIYQDSGNVQNFDAVLFSVPKNRYRLELTGPLGIGVASLLWTKDEWKIVFPTEKLYVKGNGYMVGLLNDNTLPLVHIHQIADFFEGNLLPENFTEESSKDSLGITIVQAKEATGRPFSYGKSGDSIQWILRTGRDGKLEQINFSDFENMDNRKIAKSIRFEKDRKKFLEIHIKKIDHGKSFSLGTWRLNIPNSYKPVGN